MRQKTPLCELLNQVLVAYADEFEQRLATAGFNELSLPLGVNVLRFLDGSGVRISALAQQSRVTKQAISQQVAYLENLGYVTVSSDPEDKRAKVVRLTERGRDARSLTGPLFSNVERSWTRRIGRKHVRGLRVSLETVATQLGYHV